MVDAGEIKTGSTVATYEYDGLGRRIVRAIDNSGDLDATYDDYYDGQRCVEVRDGSDDVLKHRVWGLEYIDELVQVAINDDPTDGAEDDVETYYYTLCNANYNVQLLVDDEGVVVERYEYAPYGERTVYISPGTNDEDAHAPSLLSTRVPDGSNLQPYAINEVGHQGLCHDDVSGLIYNRARYLHPRFGRFTSRDPLGYVDGMNGYEYLRSSPIALSDPTGTIAGPMIPVPGDISEGNSADTVPDATQSLPRDQRNAENVAEAFRTANCAYIVAAGQDVSTSGGSGTFGNHLTLRLFLRHKDSRVRASELIVGQQSTGNEMSLTHKLSSTLALELTQESGDGGKRWTVIARRRRGSVHAGISRRFSDIMVAHLRQMYPREHKNPFSTVVLWRGDVESGRKKWAQIIQQAGKYPYAESGPADAPVGRFRFHSIFLSRSGDYSKYQWLNWPRSEYDTRGNNSNTFIRWIIREAGLPMHMPSGNYVGHDSPKPNPKWSFTRGWLHAYGTREDVQGNIYMYEGNPELR